MDALEGHEHRASQQYVNFIQQPRAIGYMNAGLSGTANATQQQIPPPAPPPQASRAVRLVGCPECDRCIRIDLKIKALIKLLNSPRNRGSSSYRDVLADIDQQEALLKQTENHTHT